MFERVFSLGVYLKTMFYPKFCFVILIILNQKDAFKFLETILGMLEDLVIDKNNFAELLY